MTELYGLARQNLQIFFNPLQSSASHPLEGSPLQGENIELAFVEDNFGSGNSQLSDKILLILVDPEHFRIVGIVNTGLGHTPVADVVFFPIVPSVGLGFEKIKIIFSKFDHMGTF